MQMPWWAEEGKIDHPLRFSLPRPQSQGESLRMKEGHRIDSPSRGQGSPAPSGLRGKSAAAPSPLPASVTAVNQSSSFSKQVSSATGCPGSARTAQSAGRSREHSGSMTRLGLLQRHCQGQTPPALATGIPTPAQAPELSPQPR